MPRIRSANGHACRYGYERCERQVVLLAVGHHWHIGSVPHTTSPEPKLLQAHTSAVSRTEIATPLVKRGTNICRLRLPNWSTSSLIALDVALVGHVDAIQKLANVLPLHSADLFGPR